MSAVSEAKPGEAQDGAVAVGGRDGPAVAVMPAWRLLLAGAGAGLLALAFWLWQAPPAALLVATAALAGSGLTALGLAVAARRRVAADCQPRSLEGEGTARLVALEDELARLKRLLEVAPVGLYAADAGGRLMLLNRQLSL